MPKIKAQLLKTGVEKHLFHDQKSWIAAGA
jgi:hypothetical protein